MKRVEAKTVGEVLDELLRHEHLDNEFDEHRASSLWPQVVGPGINRYTISRDVRGGVMYVALSSASLRNELMMNRTVLIKRLNEAVGKDVIKEIIFR